ncbi:MAG: dihydrofolate reductase [Planctomycetota bacterium]
MKLSMIYARSENHCIGKAGGIPWRLPGDFQHFKRTTLGHTLIMGRATYEEIGSALPGRLNVVLTSQVDYAAADGVVVLPSMDAALERAARHSNEVFIAGGARLYREMFDRVACVYETVVHAEIEGDTFVPAFDFTGWQREVLIEHPADEKHRHAWTAVRWDRPSTQG